MVTILISAAFIGAALIRGEALISTWIPEGEALIRRNTVSLSEWFYKFNDLHKCNAGMRNFQKFRISRNFVQVNVASGFFFSLIDSWWTILKTHAHSHLLFTFFFECFVCFCIQSLDHITLEDYLILIDYLQKLRSRVITSIT